MRSLQTSSRSNIQQEKSVPIHPVICFINTLVNEMTTHKRLGMILDYKLSYENDLQSVNSKINKTIGLLRKNQPSFEKISRGNL